MIVGGYLLHLYCDSENCRAVECHEIQMEFTGHDKRDSIAQAKKLGWHVGRKYQYCPACSGKSTFVDGRVKGLSPKELMAIPHGPFRYKPKETK